MSKKYDRFKRQKKRLKGRKSTDSFFPVTLYMTRCDAFKVVNGNAFKLYLDLCQRYNTINNGEISYSIREAQDKFSWSPNTVIKYFEELQQLGFLICTRKGRFDQKRHASLWEITHWPLPYQSQDKAKKIYMSYKLVS